MTFPRADHPLYVEVVGLDQAHVEVFLMDDIRYARHGAGQRLCTIVGGDYTFDTRNDIPMLRMEALNGATDFEHDPSRSADLTIALPHTIYDGGGDRTIVGFLSEARLYPAGVDPLTQSDRDTRAGECTECDPTHRFAPYMPPERDEVDTLVGHAVRVELRLSPREED